MKEITTKTMFTKAELRRLIIPLILEQTLALTVGMIDTLMVSGVGESAVSGVSLVDNINILIINIFVALATGGAIVAGQYLGRQEPEQAKRAAQQLVLITAVFSLAMMVISLVLNRQILSLLYGRSAPDVLENAQVYFYVTALSFPFIALYNAAAALFRIMGDSKMAMVNALVMNLINVAGNALFIYGLRMGVLGAALSTTISRVFAAATMMWMLRNPSHEIFIRRYRFPVDRQMVRRILKLGIPSGLENGLFQMGKIILISLITSFGTAAIAANAVAFSIASIGIIPGFAMGMAMMTVVSQCAGARDYRSADGYIKYLMKLTYLYLFVLNLAIILGLHPILWLFHLSAETFAMAYQVSLIHGVGAILIFAPSITLPYAFRAAGDVKFPMAVSIFSMWVFRIGMAYLLAFLFPLGILSVWIAMMMDWLFRAVLFLWRWKSRKWQAYGMER